MKKRLLLTSLMLSALCFCGCSDEAESDEEKQTLAINGTVETFESEISASSEEVNVDGTTAPAALSDSTGTTYTGTVKNEAVTVIQTEVVGAVKYVGSSVPIQNGTLPASEPTATKPAAVTADVADPAEGVFGVQGKTEAEWLAIGQELYKEGCDMAFRYLCTGSEFPFDRENLEIIDKTYFLTTCNSFEEATSAYYQLFSRTYHGNDFEGLLLEQGGRLYAARAARGMDMTYISSEVKTLVSASDTEVVFSVLVEYEDGETTAEFTLVPEDGIWKIGKFTLPY